ncbi:MAG: CDP-diacylglycerol--glycerol-3-phosphate 3-phosphatidyltransferase [Gammaproteobacteria bacterium]|nr:CDP-diacylglycerol--glycerol-3-phosphate 3-phosphatidyltransferase [Gammaproteobacteria bacterium]
MTLPTMLTLARVIAIPFLVAIYFWAGKWAGEVAAAIFIAAAITDWLDGYLARKLDQSSAFGAFLDPVADKLIVAAALVLAAHHYQNIVISVCAVVIIGREITISALREWMAELGARGVVAVSWWGKWKTTAQMIALPCLLWEQDLFGLPTRQIGEITLVIATVLTLISMTNYLKAAYLTVDNT